MTVVVELDGWVPDVAHDFGARLTLVRNHMGWGNRAAAARECGFDKGTWSLWETSGVKPRDYAAVCEKIAQRTGCSLFWLMTGRDLPAQRKESAQVTHGYGVGAKVFRFPARPRSWSHGELVPA